MADVPVEGVTKFRADHTVRDLAPDDVDGCLAPLLKWRQAFFALGGIGQDASRYDGAGFGNVSIRIDQTRFLITGSQTQSRPTLAIDAVTLVDACDVERNCVRSFGLTPPSSEAMTHHAIYRADLTVRGVVHVHAPLIFGATRELALANISSDTPYGTPEMAQATARLVHAGHRACVMMGHEDGVVTWGPSLDAAGKEMVAHFRAVQGEPAPGAP